jgi:succinyl-CoA synthetase alpha subunit
VDALRLFQDDPNTDGVIMIGEIGGNAEETAAQYIKDHVKKPVVGFIAGLTAPPGKRMGHAGAIVSGGKGTAADKFAALERAGVRTVKSPADLGKAIAEQLQKKGLGKTKKAAGKKPAPKASLPVAAKKAVRVAAARPAKKAAKPATAKKLPGKKEPATVVLKRGKNAAKARKAK